MGVGGTFRDEGCPWGHGAGTETGCSFSEANENCKAMGLLGFICFYSFLWVAVPGPLAGGSYPSKGYCSPRLPEAAAVWSPLWAPGELGQSSAVYLIR